MLSKKSTGRGLHFVTATSRSAWQKSSTIIGMFDVPDFNFFGRLGRAQFINQAEKIGDALQVIIRV